jgi:hypothetical protein
MKFVEMTGHTLERLLQEDDSLDLDLKAAGVREHSVVRVNEQGDIELRRPEGWDVIGGLLGDFRPRIRRFTGMEWA